MTPIVRGYLECALRSTNDEGGEPLDRNYSIGDFTPEALKEAEKCCAEFLEECAKVEKLDGVRHKTGVGVDSEQGGLDLWLTSVGHGDGFWGGDWTYGELLTLEAKEAGKHIQGVLVYDGRLEFHG